MSAPQALPISIVIITLNAERTLLRTLTSVADWASDIVVVDSGSTDATMSIARSIGCRVFHRTFDGFGTQKQYAVEQALYDWVLVLDADEVVSPSLRKEIQTLFGNGLPQSHGFSMPRNLLFLGKILRFSGQYRKPILRLFDRRYGRVSPAPVHEQIEVSGPISRMRGVLHHDSYGSLEEYFAKMNHYTSLSAREMMLKHRKAHPPLLMLRFPLTFFSIYFLKGGILGGYAGFVWSLLSAVYPVVKYTKLYEQMSSGVR